MNKGCRPDPRSMPQSKEFDENYDRAFGKSEERNKGGRWRWSAELKKLVECGSDEDLMDLAKSAPIMVDRFMEGARATDGTDISNRTRRREYMRRMGITDTSDYNPDWGDRVKSASERKEDKSIRESVERSIYKLYKP